jgi:membrane associated rhomboid family serine protease
MIPLRDINPTRRFPLVTISLIVINALVFLYELSLGDRGLYDLIMTAGVIPYQVTNQMGPGVARDLITSMFLHGGWMHLLSNMLYLWIFGNNIEDVLGPIRFTVFYLLCGILASLAQVYTGPNVQTPTIGASGAIAGVLGAYVVMFPNARVQSIVFLFYFIRFVEIPAVIVLGFWFVLQFFNGLASLSVPQTGGIAYFAHIGGFVAGLALILVFRINRRHGPPPPRRTVRRNIFQDEYPDRWDGSP